MSNDNWGYTEENGPSTWAQNYPIALTGKKQSPINICSKSCKKLSDSTDRQSFQNEYTSNIENLEIENTGYGWRVDIPSTVSEKSSLKGGPLNNTYKIAQFHGHWGSDCSSGSEHTIDGTYYASELHFVHWNSDLYTSFQEAAKCEKGLAVIAVLLDISEEKNLHLEKLIPAMNLIKFKGDKAKIESSINIEEFFPQKKSYYHYEGSLTTPPLYETVTWIVFDTPIKVTSEQVAQFRQLSSTFKENTPSTGPLNILTNYRPTQPLFEREVTYYE